MIETFKGYPWNVLDAMESPPVIWLGPGGVGEFEQSLRHHLGDGAQIHHIPPDGNVDGLERPAVPVFVAADLVGEQRDALLAASVQARPGRPVIFGGSGNRETLLEAINTWHAFRLLPEGSPIQAVVVAIHKAHETLCLEIALSRGADELRQECKRLDGAIDELRATQERLLHAERLAMVGRASGTLMARIEAHFQCLGTLQSALGTLEKDPRLITLMETTMEGGQSVNTLLEDLVALTENRETRVARVSEPLDPLVERAVTFLKHDKALRAREVEVECDAGTDVVTDRHRLYLVLMNLLRNAVHATEAGDAIRVRTRREGDNAVIEVEDTGCGMPPDVLEQIFTPFFTTKGKDGMGLGLRLCKTSIERMGGELNVISEEGQGTTFTILMPISA